MANVKLYQRRCIAANFHGCLRQVIEHIGGEKMMEDRGDELGG